MSDILCVQNLILWAYLNEIRSVKYAVLQTDTYKLYTCLSVLGLLQGQTVYAAYT